MGSKTLQMDFPVAGSLVGYVTNWIAIKLLFEPADPIDCGPVVLQGLYESRQEEVSDEFGHFREKRVISSSQLLDALSNQNKKEFHHFLRKQLPYPVPDHVINAAMQAIRTAAAKPEEYNDIHTYITRRLNIENILSSRLKTLTPKNFEDLLHPVFEEDEIILIVVGGVLGAIAGVLQTRLGWGGRQAKSRAMITIATSFVCSSLFFLLPEFEEMETKVSVKEDNVCTNNRTLPKIKRRNSIIRPSKNV